MRLCALLCFAISANMFAPWASWHLRAHDTTVRRTTHGRIQRKVASPFQPSVISSVCEYTATYAYLVSLTRSADLSVVLIKRLSTWWPSQAPYRSPFHRHLHKFAFRQPDCDSFYDNGQCDWWWQTQSETFSIITSNPWNSSNIIDSLPSFIADSPIGCWLL